MKFYCGCCFLLLLGCGGSKVETVPVAGHITLDGGAWPNSGVLYFAPHEAAPGYPAKPGTANFDVAGNFTAKSFNDREGLVPGKYRVNVECWIHPPTLDANAPPAKSCVPNKYQSGQSSGFEVLVPADSDEIVLEFNVLSK